jgi:peptidoglycan/LPS O-acetylase OafA/YrhL
MAERLGYRPGLDGVRGVAILSVAVAHAFYQWLPGGGVVGVHLFFALSGFLITSLLIDERASTGGTGFAGFYLRRARRLLPALFAFLAVWSVIALVRGDGARLAAAGWSVAYVANWAKAWGGNLHELSHMWSLAVEEQFYLVWPVLLAAGWRFGRRGLLILTALAFAAAMVWRYLMWRNGASYVRVYNGSDTVAASLLAGCLAAQIRQLPVAVSLARVAPACWAVLVLLAYLPTTNREYVVVTVLPLGAQLTPSILLHATNGSRILEMAWLRRLGVLAYSLYLWHVPLLRWVQPNVYDQPRRLAAAAALAVAFAIAAASYRWVETPWLHRRTSVDGRSGVNECSVNPRKNTSESVDDDSRAYAT